MSDYGIIISKDSSDVRDKNILEQFLNNNYPFLKAFKQGFVSVNVTGPGTFTKDVEHGLGYYPVFIHYYAPDPTQPTKKFYARLGATGVFGDIAMDSYITKEKLTLSWTDTTASPGHFQSYPYVVTFYYYIFYDKLE